MVKQYDHEKNTIDDKCVIRFCMYNSPNVTKTHQSSKCKLTSAL